MSQLEDGSVRYRYGNLNKQHGIDATLSPDGTLRFEIQAHQDPASALRTRLGSGSEMFAEMMDAVGASKVRRIEGVWSKASGKTTNLEQFYENMQLYRMDEFEAAANTWTGAQAAKYGFQPTRVTFVDDGVRVIFGKAH